MPNQYAAFISYAHRYKDWVGALQRNLEACLRAAGAGPADIFLDQTDLASGRSWVAQLQEGVAKADHLILVATPESLASPRVKDEWNSFIALNRDWAEGNLHILMLVDVPLPPFLTQMQYLDVVERDEASYRGSLGILARGLLGLSRRDKFDLPSNLAIPSAPADVLSRSIRHQLLSSLAPLVKRKAFRPTVASALGVAPATLEGHITPEAAASAALVAATGDDRRVTAALRIVRALHETFEEEDDELLGKLEKIQSELERLGDNEGDGGLLSSWLKKVASDHSRLVPFFEHANLEVLDRVYVQLELRPEERLLRSQETAERGLEIGLGGEPLTLRRLLELDRDKHAWVTQRWVVRGDPGAGKTTLLRHLAATLAKESERRWIPVFESLPRLMKEPEWLLHRLERQMRRAGETVQGLAAALDREGQEGRLLLLLDGLDEVPRDDREEAEALIRQLSARWPQTPLVVTSRPIGYRRPGSEFVELDLLPFGEDQRREFLTSWFQRPTASGQCPDVEQMMKSLRSEPGLWELSENPLYLTLMALLFEEGKTPDRSRAQLYQDVFNLLLDGRHRPGRTPIEAKEAVYQILRRLACDMTTDNRDHEARSKLEARLLKKHFDSLREPIERIPTWKHSLGTFLDDLAEEVGILGPHDGPTADWKYWHRTFREALTAEFLAAELNSGGKAKTLERASAVASNESNWAEPFALLVSQANKPDTLVLSLMEANRELGIRAVATAQRLEDETLRQVLNLTDDWNERSKVYEEIPTLLDEPERAVALVDRLRQGTRNGNDLFFLDLALTGIAERWPGEAERLVESARSRFFDHIPPVADPELLWTLETPLDGPVELWRKNKDDEGWVGSPQDEEGREDYEGPQHRVHIAHPFWLGAAPVTNAQYAAFDPDKAFYPRKNVSSDELLTHPRVSVTWYEAVSFCRWLGSQPGFEGTNPRLPMEEEWEIACRAGAETRFWRGDDETDLKKIGWFEDNSENRTHEVGEKPANPWGLYDVHGNVWEWTASPFNEKRYQNRPQDKPHLLDAAAVAADLAAPPRVRRVMRGGSCWSPALGCRSACRDVRGPRDEFRSQGFRVLLSSAPSRDSRR
ncbi:MAG: SUMF1/EgtB/PvdO family nonheme iron enzyme [Acidobacteriota bacterium]